MCVVYYCDHNHCHFYHEGWCAYWDSTVELMHIRHKVCSMDSVKDNLIDELMED